METNFKIGIEISVSDATLAALGMLLQLRPAAPIAVEPVKEKPAKAKKAKEEPAPVVVDEPAPAKEPEPAPAPKADIPVPKKDPSILTEEDVREAMFSARDRIEGSDWREKKSEGFKKYHKILTEFFVKYATDLGSDRPSALPLEKRAEFIELCDGLRLNDGNVEELPF